MNLSEAIGAEEEVDGMEISSSSSEVIGRKICCVCTEAVGTTDFIICTNCNICVHKVCIKERSDLNWCCEQCAEEEVEDAALSGEEIYKDTVSMFDEYTTVKPFGDRVLVKIKTSEEKPSGGVLLQTKPQVGEVVAVGEGRTNMIIIEPGNEVVFSNDAGTKIEINGVEHRILKEVDILDFFEFDYSTLDVPKFEDVKDLMHISDQVLIKVAQVEEQRTGRLLLTETSREKASFGTIITVGPDALNIRPGVLKSMLAMISRVTMGAIMSS